MAIRNEGLGLGASGWSHLQFSNRFSVPVVGGVVPGLAKAEPRRGMNGGALCVVTTATKRDTGGYPGAEGVPTR